MPSSRKRDRVFDQFRLAKRTAPKVNSGTALRFFSGNTLIWGCQISSSVALVGSVISKWDFLLYDLFRVWWPAVRRKRGVAKSTFCVPCWDSARGKRYKNGGFALSGRAHGLIYEVHCDARRANFLHFCKNCPKFLARKTLFRGKIAKVVFASRSASGKYAKT